MKIDKNKIAEFVYLIKLRQLKPFYDKFGIDEKINCFDINFFDLPLHAYDEEDFDLDYLNQVVEYLVNIYLLNFERRFIDEIIETLAIFFSRVHSFSILGIDKSIGVCNEEYSFSLLDKDWFGYNWEKLPEKTRKKNEVDRIFFREISKYFIENILEYPLPKPASRYDMSDSN